MSFRNLQGNNIPNRVTFKDPLQATAKTAWVRNPTWPTVTTPTTSENKVVGLYAVWPNVDNFFAVNITTSAGQYTVDYGDGSATVNTNSATQLNYNYSYSASGLANTDGPVTFTDSTDTVNRTAHGYTNGQTVQFYNIVSTTGITAGQTYYVINATANTFQISTSSGGSAVALTTDGSGTLLPYKIATVTITPTTGGSTFSTINLTPKHSQTGLVNGYSNNWLELLISSTETGTTGTITWGGSSSTTSSGMLENVYVFSAKNSGGTVPVAQLLRKATLRFNNATNLTTGAMLQNCSSLTDVSVTFENTGLTTNTSDFFNGCASLTSVPLFNTASVTTMSNMFSGCRSLTSVPFFNTASVTTMSGMFNACNLLTTVPVFNTASVTSMSTMFVGCSSLTTVPLLNTASVGSMANMFQNCASLSTVPFFNTASVTNMTSMFAGCTSLTTVPLFNTASVTSMGGASATTGMFAGCTSLITVPLFNTGLVTNFGFMFQGCTSLTTVPLFNTVSATSMQGMFQNCSSLNTVPLFNTASVTTMASMFQNCVSLTTVPLFNTASVTIMGGASTTGMFAGCISLTTVPLLNTVSVTAFGFMFQNCSSLVTVPSFNTAAATGTTAFTSMFNGCTSLQYIPSINYNVTAITTSASYTNMFATCSSLSRIDGVSGSGVTGPKFSFSVANCKLSGTNLDALYTWLPIVSTQIITVTGNYGTATDTPSIATGKGWTVTGS